MKRDKKRFRYLLSALIRRKSSATEAHRSSQKLILSPLHQLKRVNTDIDDLKIVMKQRTFRSTKKFENAELQALLDKNSTQMLKELAEALNVDKLIISYCLHAMGKFQKESKWVFHTNWLFKIV